MPIGAGTWKSSSVTPKLADRTRSSPVAARWLSTVLERIPPAHSDSRLTSSLPVISRATSIARSTASA